MKKINRISLTIALAALTLSACKDSDSDGGITPTNPEVTDIALEKTEYIVSDAGDTFTVTVGGNADYTYSCSSSWVDLAFDTSAPHNLKVVVDANSTYDAREATVVLKQKSNQRELSFTIYQTQKGAIVLAKNAYTLTSGACEMELELQTSVTVTVSDLPDWLTITKTRSRALVKEYYTVKATANTTGAKRSATVTFKGGDVQQKVTFTQNGPEDSFNVTLVHSNSSFAFSLGGADAMTLSVDWGDGTVNALSEHNYSTAGTHTVSISSEGPTSISIPVIGDLESMTLPL